MIKTHTINIELHTIYKETKTPLYLSIFIEIQSKKDESTN